MDTSDSKTRMQCKAIREKISHSRHQLNKDQSPQPQHMTRTIWCYTVGSIGIELIKLRPKACMTEHLPLAQWPDTTDTNLQSS